MLELRSSDWPDYCFRLKPRARIRREVPTRADDGSCRFLSFLLAPESSFPLEFSEAAILEYCDGATPFRQLVAHLSRYFDEEPTAEYTDSIANFLTDLIEHNLLDQARSPMHGDVDRRESLDHLWAGYSAACPQPSDELPFPRGLLAEVSYRCPLRCPYCSNPLELNSQQAELSTETWVRAIAEAASLGVLHIGFSGGEPLVRPDLATLIAAAQQTNLYTNLLTSGVGLSDRRARELKQSGLDSIQISFQDTQEESANEIAGLNAHAGKLQAIEIARGAGFPLSLNIVLHRQTMDRIESIIEFAAVRGAERLELANVQFYGWALKNRDRLIPTRAQVERVTAAAQKARDTYRGIMEILYVPPDYFGTRPKPCMQGWGRQHITINPTGAVLPCPTAGGIAGLHFDNIRERSLREIWERSPAFVRFRGTAWLPEPCRTCEYREVDFGGCRCQAAILTGDPGVTDPACSLSPHRHLLERYLEAQADVPGKQLPPLMYRVYH